MNHASNTLSNSIVEKLSIARTSIRDTDAAAVARFAGCTNT